MPPGGRPRFETTHWSLVLAAGAMLAGVCWSIVVPERGLHDRLAGTWLVPK